MGFETIECSKRSVTAHVILNRPHVINAFNTRMRDELYEALEWAREDRDVRVVVLRGAGERGFCAGADLTEFGTAPSQAVARDVRWERDLWDLMRRFRKPIVAALHGYVIGTGMEMACFCDVRLAATDAEFGMPELSLGLVPAAGGSQTIPRDIGLGRAVEMFLAGPTRRLSAREALAIGLVQRVVEKDALFDEAERLARQLARWKPSVVEAVKRAVVEGMDMPLETGLRLERRLAARLGGATV
ncbi:MAG: enoyl-CoA hydratase/isomerase family protein [SAR202 cluster bacterium]|nr:enoyl-CoA hydratase/isomerase family protein [SAR202 cluster bacterium]